MDNQISPNQDARQEIADKKKKESESLLANAQKTMEKSAFEIAHEQVKYSQNDTQTQDDNEPIDLIKGTEPNSPSKADELNGIGLESTSTEQTPYDIMPPDVSEGVRYQKYRNTGVAYFDNKADLSLLDAYLAKQLGLNVSYNFHKIDMKVDNRTKNTSFTQLYKRGAELEAWGNEAHGNMATMYLKQTGGVDEKTQKAVAGTTIGAFMNFKADNLALADRMAVLHAEKNQIKGATGNYTHQNSKNLLKNATQSPNRALDIMIYPMQRNIYDLKANLNQAKAMGASPQYIKQQQNLIKRFEREVEIFKSIQGKELQQQRQGVLSIFADQATQKNSI